MRLYKEVRKRYPKVAIMKIDLTSVSKILKAVADNEREKLDKKRQATELRLMKEQAVEQARHCVPYVPKLTSAHNLKKQSSLSVLQSFTSAVQQLCSPEKTLNHSESAASESQTSSSVPTKTKPAAPSQCIDLIILSDSEEEMEQNHFRWINELPTGTIIITVTTPPSSNPPAALYGTESNGTIDKI